MAEGSAGLRGRKKARTRTAIIEAAVRLFAEKGYEATTVEEVAAEAEVSPATVFRYFGTKEDLIYTEVGAIDRVPGEIAARPPDEGEIQAVGRALQPILAGGGFGTDRLRVLYQAIAKSTVLQGRGTMMLQRWEGAIAEGLARRNGVSPSDQSTRLRAAMLGRALALASEELVSGRQPDFGSAFVAVLEVMEGIVAEWAGRSGPQAGN